MYLMIPFEIVCLILEELNDLVQTFRCRRVSKLWELGANHVIMHTHKVCVPSRIKGINVAISHLQLSKKIDFHEFILWFDPDRVNDQDISFKYFTKFSYHNNNWFPHIGSIYYPDYYYLEHATDYHVFMNFKRDDYRIVTPSSWDQLMDEYIHLKDKCLFLELKTDNQKVPSFLLLAKWGKF
jgi:hypothetical protein